MRIGLRAPPVHKHYDAAERCGGGGGNVGEGTCRPGVFDAWHRSSSSATTEADVCVELRQNISCPFCLPAQHKQLLCCFGHWYGNEPRTINNDDWSASVARRPHWSQRLRIEHVRAQRLFAHLHDDCPGV